MFKFIKVSILLITFLSYAQWTKTNGPIGGKVRSFASNGTDMFVTLGGGGIHGSFDNGYNWVGKNNGLLSSDVKVIVYKDSILFTGTDEGVYRSNDDGSTWTARNSGISTSIWAMEKNGNTLFVGTGNGGVFYSDDYASNWSPRNNGLPTDWIETLLQKDSLLFAGTGNAGVYVSSDKGLNWSARNNGLNDSLYVRNILDHNGTLIACSKPLGVFYSMDDGLTWKEFNSGLTIKYIASLEIYDGNLYAGSIGDGVYIRPLSDLEILGTPVNLTITGNTLNWDIVSGASYYRIYRSETPYSGFSEIDTSATNSYEETDTGSKYF